MATPPDMDFAVQPPPTSAEDRPEKMAIILMGVTGSGKSTFISLLTDQKVEVGHGLESHTTEAASYTFNDSGREIILVDTPGFDDTNRPDAEILQEMAHFLVALYNSDVRLAGIVYLHRITDPRFSGTAGKNLEILQRLCGPPNFDSVVLVMNMWDSIDVETAMQRELELRHTFWTNMLKGNSTMTPHTGTRESALQIVRGLVDNAKPRLILSIQHELAEEGKTLDSTAAGQYVQKEMLEAKAKHQQDVAYLKSSMDDAIRERDVNLLRALREERDAAEAKIRATVLETQQMNKTLDQLVAQGDHQKFRKLLPPSSTRPTSDSQRPTQTPNLQSSLPHAESYASVPLHHHAGFTPALPTDMNTPDYNMNPITHTPLPGPPPTTTPYYPPHHQITPTHPFPPPLSVQTAPPLDGAEPHFCKPECKQRCEQEKLQLRILMAEEEGRKLQKDRQEQLSSHSHARREPESRGRSSGKSGSRGQAGDPPGNAMKSVKVGKSFMSSAASKLVGAWGLGGGGGSGQVARGEVWDDDRHMGYGYDGYARDCGR